MPKLQSLLPLIFLLFGLSVAAYAFIELGDVATFGAGFMPAITGILIGLLSSLDFITVRLKADASSSGTARRDILSVVLVACTVIFYIYIVDIIGFIFTTSLIMAGLFVFFLPQHRLPAAVAAVVLSTGIYYLFSKVLLVPLPAGILF
ncbi:tripartite tricarboxylate transporter TctB family protein [Pectobacterium betavasculorum]|uniref:tripartite tricarboxylate transporter TctB family protein n=1 Tax=Pectobacterium betavasculorum TaxID=55207 RepID=UPI00313BC3B5